MSIVLTSYYHVLLKNTSSSSDVYKEWQQLGKRRDLESWEMTPATVNAYYNPPANEVGFTRTPTSLLTIVL